MSEQQPRRRRFSDYCRITFAGFAMGVANVIPGVSGGTMAFILGVFEELVDSIRKIASAETFRLLLRGRFRELYDTLPWRFLLALGIGIAVAFAGVSKLFIYLLEQHPTLTFAFFFGLIAASIVSVFRKVKQWGPGRFVSLLCGAVVAYVMITLVPVSTPNVWYVSFLCGVICICAMILPGISGSFLLLVLGQYQYVWGAVGDFAMGRITLANLNTLWWLGLGAVIGVGAFSHLLNYLFRRQHDLTVAALIGFMVGSMPRLWPWQRIVEVSVKTQDALVRLQLPTDAGQLEQYESLGAEVTPLVVRNVAPDGFGGSFWAVVGLAVFGLLLVLATEYFAARGDRKKMVEQK